jgi:hypothetical protein
MLRGHKIFTVLGARMMFLFMRKGAMTILLVSQKVGGPKPRAFIAGTLNIMLLSILTFFTTGVEWVRYEISISFLQYFLLFDCKHFALVKQRIFSIWSQRCLIALWTL